jgi:hypothetical protein
MSLKPQDIMVAFKLCTYKEKRPAISVVAQELSMSPSEIHGAIKRLQRSRLIHGPELLERPNVSALEEFLLHGFKYVFPPEHGSVTRGLATSYAAEPLRNQFPSGDELPPVWPSSEGDAKGVALKPLYKSAPKAAQSDPRLYEYLALADAIRDGRARERKAAERELVKRLHADAKP